MLMVTTIAIFACLVPSAYLSALQKMQCWWVATFDQISARRLRGIVVSSAKASQEFRKRGNPKTDRIVLNRLRKEEPSYMKPYLLDGWSSTG